VSAATSKRGKAAANGAAAAAQSEDEAKVLEVEGLKLDLPARLPFKSLRNFRSSLNNIEGAIGFLEDVLGPEQMENVWDLDLDVDRGLELTEKVLGVYGLTEGDSEASAE
jgi:hypothetical protein